MFPLEGNVHSGNTSQISQPNTESKCGGHVTSYPLAGEVYLGRQPGAAREINQGARVVRTLTNKWLDSGRNIVMDNFLTTILLAEELLSRNTTIVGTIRNNKPDIPSELTVTFGRDEFSTLFAFSGELTVASQEK